MGNKLLLAMAFLVLGIFVVIGWMLLWTENDAYDLDEQRLNEHPVIWPQEFKAPFEGRKVDQVRIEVNTTEKSSVDRMMAALRDLPEVCLVDLLRMRRDNSTSTLLVAGMDLDVEKLKARISDAGGIASNIEPLPGAKIWSRVTFTLQGADRRPDPEALQKALQESLESTHRLIHAHVEWLYEPLHRLQATIKGEQLPAKEILNAFNRFGMIVEKVEGPEPVAGDDTLQWLEKLQGITYLK